MSFSPPPAIVWFRRSLRVDDNPVLRDALDHAGTVVPLFVLDDALLLRDDTAPGRVRFLLEGLEALDAALRERGGYLVVRRGDPAVVLPEVAAQTGASVVFHGRETEPWGRARDLRVGAALTAAGVALRPVSDHLIVEPEEVSTGKGTPYTVFTPFRKAWLAQPVPTPLAPPPTVPVPVGISSEPLPKPPDGPSARVPAGEAAGAARMRTFVGGALARYGSLRDRPDLPGTSRLSAHLKFGMVSSRSLLAMARDLRRSVKPDTVAEVEAFISELCWRDFYHHILWHFPHVATGGFRPGTDAIAWENDEQLFQAWTEGRTGYPFVDAAMRELRATGWMHNRARMVVASFLTKDLLVDWRWGERHFMRHLIDGDQAANNGGWQWAAGTGTDAQPWFRIFNPVAQGEKFDPDGEYVRRWVPELASVPAPWIHRPWTLSAAEQVHLGCRVGVAYPAPIVDHARQRVRALEMYRAASGREENQ